MDDFSTTMMTGPDGLPVAFHDLKASRLPLHIIVFDHGNEILWQETIRDAGALRVPAFPGQVSRVVLVPADGHPVQVP